MGIPWIVNRKTGNNYYTSYLLLFLHYLYFILETHSQLHVNSLKNLLYLFLNHCHFTFPNSPHSYLIHCPLPYLDMETPPPALELNQSSNISRYFDWETKTTTKTWPPKHNSITNTVVSEHFKRVPRRLNSVTGASLNICGGTFLLGRQSPSKYSLIYY